MATPEDEIQVLREKNTELVQKVQHWKMLAAQREDEKLDLMKELNEMRLKLARLRNNGNIQASKLDTALQSASEKALAHLVRASGEIAGTINLVKAYMRERKEVDAVSPRWSAIGGTPKTERVHRVPPMMIGGQSIQPVVSLSRTLLNTSNPRPAARLLNQNRNVTERAVPLHMLQDVYIPLTRIDAAELQANNMETETEANDSENSAEELGLDDTGERSDIEESQRMSDDNEDDDYNSSRRLDAVSEDMEPEDETPPRNSRTDNPIEGPSWLLDAPSSTSKAPVSQPRKNLEPDSTTEVEEAANTTIVNVNTSTEREEGSQAPSCTTWEFSPTVRRRKRTSSPPPATPRRLSHYSPRPSHARRNSNTGRVLKVMVAKMRLDSVSPSASSSPVAKRAATALELHDAPSPNGATVAGVIVSEATINALDLGGGEPAPHITQRRDGRRPKEDARRPSHDTRRTNQDIARANQNTGRESQDTGRPSQDTGRPSQDTGRPSQDTGLPSEDTRNSSNMNEREETRVQQEQDGRENRSRSRNLSSRYGAGGGSHDGRDNDSDSGSGGDLHSEGRTRRKRNKVVSYQERPLNRKMRR